MNLSFHKGYSMNRQRVLLTSMAVSTITVSSALLGSSGELLVKWQDGPESYAAESGNARIGSTVKRNFKALGWQHVKLPADMSVRDGLDAYRSLGTVLAVEPNGNAAIEPLPKQRAHDEEEVRIETSDLRKHIGLHGPPTPSVIPNDPMFSQQWNMKRIGATNAWRATTGSSHVVVAILDTGVDYNHPDLAANMWRNPGETGFDAEGNDRATNRIDDDDNGYVDDVFGVDVVNGTGDPMDLGSYNPGAPGSSEERPYYHGTMIAGIIGAIGNNAEGVAGLNWSVRLMAIRYVQATDADPQLSHQVYWSRYLAAWDYLIAMKRRGANVRVASTSDIGVVDSQAVRDAIEAAGAEGILAVFAAGNQAVNQDLYSSFPAAFRLPSTINVAASTESDTLADWAAFGASTVDLAAPGVNITTTARDPLYVSGAVGSSFACPHVSGAAALLLSLHPSLTVNELKAALFGSVDQPAGMKGKLITHGRLNIARALEYLTDPNPPAIVLNAQPAGQWTRTDAPIRVTFNHPMNRASVQSTFGITPPIGGVFEWASDHRSVVFRHAEGFDGTTAYTVRIRGTAEAEDGGTLDGNFNRSLEGSPGDDYVWTFRFRAPNDDFAQATPLNGASGSRQAANTYAWMELGEPPHVLNDYVKVACSLWYRWTAPEQGGWHTFDLTDGTSFDSLLAIYTGGTLAGLKAVGGSDNYGTRTSSRVSLYAEPGTSYAIVVASRTTANRGYIPLPDQRGNFRLKWYPTPAPGFTSAQFSPASAAPGTMVTLTGTNFTGATGVFFNGASASFANAPTNSVDLRITATVPPDATSGPITIVTPHGSVTSTATFQLLPPPLTVRWTPEGRVEISWPATSAELGLESAAQLTSLVWEPVSALPPRSAGQSRVLVDGAGTARFFRLRGAP